MATPDDVLGELLNNGDVVTIYDGAQGLFPEGGRRTGSLRYALFKLIWDFLRFQKTGDFVTATDPSKPTGMRDQVSRLLAVTEANNVLLTAIAVKVGATPAKDKPQP